MASKPTTTVPALNTGKSKFAALLAAMVAVATPIYVGWEGSENKAYRDIVGVLTICSGDTRNVRPGQVATDAECNDRTAAIMEEYGTDVYKLSPGIENYRYMWASYTIFTANVGVGAYGKSSIRRLYNAGEYRAACRYMMNYKYAGGKVVQGLINRRNGTTDRIGEYELCLVDAIPLELGHVQRPNV